MNHEEGENTDQQQIHKQPDEVKAGIELAVARVGVGLILNETLVGARMALAAGLNEAGLIDGRIRIAGRQHLMRAVAVPAAGGLDVAAERAELRVEGVTVGG